jgi:hypothetical protein
VYSFLDSFSFNISIDSYIVAGYEQWSFDFAAGNLTASPLFISAARAEEVK